jgi:hypothetical protein
MDTAKKRATARPIRWIMVTAFASSAAEHLRPRLTAVPVTTPRQRPLQWSHPVRIIGLRIEPGSLRPFSISPLSGFFRHGLHYFAAIGEVFSRQASVQFPRRAVAFPLNP